eukprot:Awhi_evm1s5345
MREFKTLPEVFEVVNGECLLTRTKGLAKTTGLGPPDMCHVTKIQEKHQGLFTSSGNNTNTVHGSYHFCYGADCSSPASIAAYFNALVNDMSTDPNGARWKIQS